MDEADINFKVAHLVHLVVSADRTISDALEAVLENNPRDYLTVPREALEHIILALNSSSRLITSLYEGSEEVNDQLKQIVERLHKKKN